MLIDLTQLSGFCARDSVRFTGRVDAIRAQEGPLSCRPIPCFEASVQPLDFHRMTRGMPLQFRPLRILHGNEERQAVRRVK